MINPKNGARSLYRTRHYIENNINIELISQEKNNIVNFVFDNVDRVQPCVDKKIYRTKKVDF